MNMVSAVWYPSTTVTSDGVSHKIELMTVGETGGSKTATINIDDKDQRELKIPQYGGPYSIHIFPLTEDLRFIFKTADSNNVEYRASLLIGVEKNLSSLGNTSTTFIHDGINHTIELITATLTTATISIDNNGQREITEQYNENGPYTVYTSPVQVVSQLAKV